MKQYLIDPFGTPAYMENRMFAGPYGILRRLFAERGVELNTYDLGDLAKADMVLLFNYDRGFYERCKAAGVPKEKLALFAFEPRVVIPEQYEKSIWDQFGYVFTFLEDEIDEEKVHRLRFPQAQSVIEDVPDYADRKHLILINANKYSYVPNELYSLRRRVIRHFETQPDEFDLYGFLWDKGSRVIGRREAKAALKYRRPHRLAYDRWEGRRPYTSYRGSVEDKYRTLADYRFCICYENEKEARGYMTEKLFDCLATGTIPVYLGAPNVEDYIPRDAFVDMRDFRNFGELSHYLRGMSEREFRLRQQAGRDYMNSEQFEPWKPEPVFRKFVDTLAPAR